MVINTTRETRVKISCVKWIVDALIYWTSKWWLPMHTVDRNTEHVVHESIEYGTTYQRNAFLQHWYKRGSLPFGMDNIQMTKLVSHWLSSAQATNVLLYFIFKKWTTLNLSTITGFFLLMLGIWVWIEQLWWLKVSFEIRWNK